MFVLSPSATARDEDIAGWAALVDGASITAESSEDGSSGDNTPAPAPPPAPAPAPDYGNVGVNETQYTVRLRNVGSGCSAVVTFSSQQYTLSPGEVREVQAAGGDHDFEWVNNDGTSGSGRYNVPRTTTFGAGCRTPEAPRQPDPEPERSAPAPAPAPAPVAEGEDSAEVYYAALDGQSYSWTDISTSSGIKNTYTFKIGDASCPLIYKYNELATGYGLNIWRTVVGCATFLGNVPGSAPGSGFSNWRFSLVAFERSSGSKGNNLNELWWQGQLQVFTDGFRMFGPTGFFGSQRNRSKVWAKFE